MNSSVRLLDCSLRDGGHVNGARFGYLAIRSIISELVKAGVDIIEAGFLWDTPTENDIARYHTIAELKKYLPADMGKSKLSLMADNVDLSHLEDNDGTVEYIRLSFRKTEFDWAEKTAAILTKKGYQVIINPIHCSSFSDADYLEIIDRVNAMKPYGFSIVDTFGALRQKDLGRIHYLVENNLDKDITLGVHLHANLGLAYSLAQYLLSIASPTRNLIIDASLYGIGKVPGNLCIEQIVDYLNNEYGTQYNSEPIYDAIDEYIMQIYAKTPWGYTVPYALSAQFGVHRTYAEHLQEKKRLRTKDMRRLLAMIAPEHSEIFDKKHIEELYNHYMNVETDDSAAVAAFADDMAHYNKVLILAPGSSLRAFSLDSVDLTDTCVICVNFVYDSSAVNYVFYTNAKRMEDSAMRDGYKLMITSNLMKDAEADFVFSRNELAYHGDKFCDDSTIMLLNLLKRVGVKQVCFAGFDGFKRGNDNFYKISYERAVRNDDFEADSKKQILQTVYDNFSKEFLTPSMYE